MPTIEIASINSTRLDLIQSDFDIAIIEESKLRSHPWLFYEFLQEQKGVIIHIGNPDFKEDKDCGIFLQEKLLTGILSQPKSSFQNLKTQPITMGQINNSGLNFGAIQNRHK